MPVKDNEKIGERFLRNFVCVKCSQLIVVCYVFLFVILYMYGTQQCHVRMYALFTPIVLSDSNIYNIILLMLYSIVIY